MSSAESTADGRFTQVQGVRVPTLIYGTAWKENDTASLTLMALRAGFAGVDTANQRRTIWKRVLARLLRRRFALA